MPGDRRQSSISPIPLIWVAHFTERIPERSYSGWQLSGITQLQSGANLTYLSSNDNFNLSLNNAIIPGSVSGTNPNGITITNQSIFGTNAVQLNPLVTCNPKSGWGRTSMSTGIALLPQRLSARTYTAAGTYGPGTLTRIWRCSRTSRSRSPRVTVPD